MKDEQLPAAKHSLYKAKEGFIEVNPKPNEKELQKYYHDKYYQLGLGSYETTYSDAELKYFNNRLDRNYCLIQEYIAHLSNPTLLDIGCGEGFSAAYFARRGFTVNSIDYSAAGVLQQNPHIYDNHEIGNIFEHLDAKIAGGQRFDVLILQNVLEHVIDPRNLCKMMSNLLNDSGIALVTVPNDFSLTQLTALGEGKIQNEFWISPPDHLNYFNTLTLKRFAVAQGWKVVDMISDFPVDWFLFHEGSNYVTDKTKGKAAHQARISIENMLHTGALADVIDFYRAAASIGIGRDITAVMKPI